MIRCAYISYINTTDSKNHSSDILDGMLWWLLPMKTPRYWEEKDEKMRSKMMQRAGAQLEADEWKTGEHVKALFG